MAIIMDNIDMDKLREIFPELPKHVIRGTISFGAGELTQIYCESYPDDLKDEDECVCFHTDACDWCKSNK